MAHSDSIDTITRGFQMGSTSGFRAGIRAAGSEQGSEQRVPDGLRTAVLTEMPSSSKNIR
jgi:hypothetical protein